MKPLANSEPSLFCLHCLVLARTHARTGSETILLKLTLRSIIVVYGIRIEGGESMTLPVIERASRGHDECSSALGV